jgi:hypothetical protein
MTKKKDREDAVAKSSDLQEFLNELWAEAIEQPPFSVLRCLTNSVANS